MGSAIASGWVELPPALTVAQVFRRFWPYTYGYRRWLVVQVALVIVGLILDSIAIWLFKLLVDDVLAPANFAPFPRIAVLYVCLTAGIGLVGFGNRYLSAWLGGRFVLDLRTHMFGHVQQLSLDFFERRRLGDTLTRLGADVSSIEAVVLSGLTSAASYLLRISLYGGILLVLQWQLTVTVLIVGPVLWAVSRFFSRRLKVVSREGRRLSAQVSAVAEEGLSNAMLVQAYNRQDHEVARYRLHAEASLMAQLRATRLRGFFSPITELLELTGLLLVIGYGTWLLSQHRLTLGELMVFLAYFGQLFSPLRGLASFANSLSSAAASAERVAEVLDLEPELERRAFSVLTTRLTGALALEDVTFRYSGRSRSALERVDLAVEAGTKVALVGGSGSGKTTVIKLLLRFYDPDAGSVTLDGYDLRSLSITQIRRSVAVVMQETLVFDGTIRDNILWGRPEASARQLAEAVERADVGSFLGRLPDGLDTRVGQRGRSLSGGERQRVAIARALLRDAPILVLDEPTTGLDAASARRVLEPLGRLMEGRTTLLISHNLTQVRDADQIVVLDRGRVVQRGTHDELIGSGGEYGRLVRDADHPSVSPLARSSSAGMPPSGVPTSSRQGLA